MLIYDILSSNNPCDLRNFSFRRCLRYFPFDVAVLSTATRQDVYAGFENSHSTLYDFIFGLSERHFEKIADDASQPLFNRTHIFRPKICKPQKNAKSFFPLFMSHFNNLRS